MSPIEMALAVHHHNSKANGPTCRVVISSVNDVYLICETPEELILCDNLVYECTGKIVTDGKLSISVKDHYVA